MALAIILSGVAVLLGVADLAIMIGRSRGAVPIVYGACLTVSLISFAGALFELTYVRAVPSTVTLPLGLPWLGAHFRIDALAAFFLAVVDLGPLPPACLRLATEGTRKHRCVCCRSIQPSSPA